MPVVPATIKAIVPDQLRVRWAKGAPIGDVEGFVSYLLEADGFDAATLGDQSPHLTVEIGDGYCELEPDPDLWSMVLAEEIAVRLARSQSGEILDGSGQLLAQADAEQSHPWRALESVGVMSLFRPRPDSAPDMHSHPLIPLEDCKISGVSFNEQDECALDVYFDYWARPCAFLVEEEMDPVLLYRPMYRFRQALLGRSDYLSVVIKERPQSRIYGALGVKGYKVTQHKVDRKFTWTIKGQEKGFMVRTRTSDAWLTRSVPLWYREDRLLLGAITDRDFTTDELLDRKEQHWDMTDAVWGQEWYVAAHPDGALNPFGRIYKADPTAALLDLPAMEPKL